VGKNNNPIPAAAPAREKLTAVMVCRRWRVSGIQANRRAPNQGNPIAERTK
jgi:hypothetical protein